ncbi:YhgE/Pip domain-containing protein [Allobacillus halotolerans]|uniref:YhgE/Pip domain-containing protein n=1 Tax=Allobacillus halotolerans TaxID=570278 RepID=A0ABS6GJJ0_9BACI|nr:YhgE/Pip domain-containing protein [Allobacillus halotolerans]MBU6079422.1 YhgE/Pip domain-containing protein [Allobacillus halotolerans]
MKNSWKIYFQDLKNISRNWVAAILIGGLILLPSLYAWFNIEASWDPYSQTDQIPIGVVNEDSGGEIKENKINVGTDLVETLENNQSMDWHFTNREKAMKNLKYGDYFAVIVIPEDFSENLSSVISNEPKKSEMEYYVNEKINAVSPKITDKGASTIVQQVSSNFISAVNGVIFEMFDDIGIELNDKLPDIKQFENYIFEMEKQLPEIYELVSNGLEDTKNAQSIINKAQNKLPKAERTTNDGLQTVNETADLLSKAEDRLNEMAPQIETDLEKAQNTAEDINKLLQDAKNMNIDFSEGKELQQSIDRSLDDATSRLDEIESDLKQLKEMNQAQQNKDSEQENESNGDGSTDQENHEQNGNQQDIQNNNSDNDQVIDDALERLSILREALEEVQDNGQNITAFIEDKKQEVDSVVTDLEELSANTANKIGDFLKDYKENIEPVVKQKISDAQQTLTSADDILSEIKSTIPEVKEVLSSTETHIGDGQGMLNTILGEYPYVNSKINELADRIREIQGETDINEMIELLRNDPEAEKNFFEEPVKLSKNELFPIPNYGSGMTPFYTVLAIWVGGLLLISLLAVDVHDREGLTGRERYFGRMFTFLTIGLLQTLVVTLGDWLLIGSYIAHPVWFVLFGLIISIVFMTLIYTLVSVFGDVGKAMVIVLLVLQIAGAGGTYPVILLPKLFQAISPFLPFTYAIDLMREAVGGIIWESAIHDMIILSLFGIGALLFGTLLKNVINKHTDKLMKKSKDAGLFH